MVTLKGKDIYLRALEPEDLDFIYTIENDAHVWEVSHSQTPYSRYILKKYIRNAHMDIYEAKQLRLVICANDGEAIGFIDLFDFDPANRRAGIGIIIYNVKNRKQGVGTEALALVIDYAFTVLNLHQLYANIGVANVASKTLFTNFGFTLIGIKKDWNMKNGAYDDEALYQLVNKI